MRNFGIANPRVWIMVSPVGARPVNILIHSEEVRGSYFRLMAAVLPILHLTMAPLGRLLGKSSHIARSGEVTPEDYCCEILVLYRKRTGDDSFGGRARSRRFAFDTGI